MKTNGVEGGGGSICTLGRNLSKSEKHEVHATWGATQYASLSTLPDESSQAQTLEAEASTSTATAVRAILLFVPSKLPRTTK